MFRLLPLARRRTRHFHRPAGAPTLASHLWQGAAALAGLVLLAVLAVRFEAVLAARGLGLGFDFLGRTAGISLSETVLPFSPRDSLGWMILAGLANTLRLAIAASVLATVIGVAVGIMRLSGNPLLRALAGGYVGLLRNTPLLLQIFFWYALVLKLPSVTQAISFGDVAYLSRRGLQFPGLLWNGPGEGHLAFAFAIVCTLAALALRLARRSGRWRLRHTGVLATGLIALALALLAVSGAFTLDIPYRRGFSYVGGLTLSPEFVAITVSQSLYAGAFIAELVRGGIEGVPAGQKEAAWSLGLSRWRMLRHVVLPQALIVIIPSITTQYVSIIKNSSLAAAIGYPELFWSIVSTINISGRSVDAILVMLVLYLVPTFIGTALIERFNRRIAARSKR